MLCSNRVFLPIRRAASWLDSVEKRYTHILFISWHAFMLVQRQRYTQAIKPIKRFKSRFHSLFQL